jgi:hypothetical protein
MSTVPLIDRAAGALWSGLPGLGPALARLESRALDAELRDMPDPRPVLVCGVARSGTTILLEMLARIPGFATHRYADFPGLWTPCWWRWLSARLPRQAARPMLRAHGDRIMVTRDSPEAMEEPLWIHHVRGRHDPAVDQRLGRIATETEADWYRTYIRKLVLGAGARRYLAKGNYNLVRLPWLLSALPSARFVVLAREPGAHVASLVRQDRRFGELAGRDPAVARQLVRSGHFEFGPQKRPLHLGDAVMTARIAACFEQGDVAHGYALAWREQYACLLQTLESDPAVAAATLIVGYERLCSSPRVELQRIAMHIGAGDRAWVDQTARLLAADAEATRAEGAGIDACAPVWDALCALAARGVEGPRSG